MGVMRSEHQRAKESDSEDHCSIGAHWPAGPFGQMPKGPVACCGENVQF